MLEDGTLLPRKRMRPWKKLETHSNIACQLGVKQRAVEDFLYGPARTHENGDGTVEPPVSELHINKPKFKVQRIMRLDALGPAA